MIEGTDFGSVAVTVDGANAGEFAGVRDIDVKTGAGDDRLELVAVQIGGSLRVKLGDGDDDLFVSTIATPVVRPMIVGGDVDVTSSSVATSATRSSRKPTRTRS